MRQLGLLQKRFREISGRGTLIVARNKAPSNWFTSKMNRLQVQSNEKKYKKFLLKFRKYVKIAFFLNKFKLKFNTFFKNIFLNNLKVKNKNFNFFIKNQYYFNNLNLIYFFIKRFYTNQSVLIGNLISPHYINLFSKKK